MQGLEIRHQSHPHRLDRRPHDRPGCDTPTAEVGVSNPYRTAIGIIEATAEANGAPFHSETIRTLGPGCSFRDSGCPA